MSREKNRKGLRQNGRKFIYFEFTDCRENQHQVKQFAITKSRATELILCTPQEPFRTAH